MKKKTVNSFFFSLLFLLLLAGCGNSEKKNNPNYNSDNYLSGTHYAVMDIENYGQIYMELYADVAPASVTNFVNLVKEGFYNGLTFHRVVSGFVIQGGCPEGTGAGGSTYTVPGEFATNGFNNKLSHLRGTLSMARTSNDKDSASSQFFIMHEDNTGLDGYYAAFGRVVSGMEIVDKICSDVPVQDEEGTVLKENQPVITYISINTKNQMPVIEEAEEEVNRPDPTAKISIAKVNTEDVTTLNPTDRWIVNQEGEFYVLSSTEDLLSFALYEIDLTQSVTYSKDNMLAYSSNIGAGDYIVMQITVTTEGFPDQLLVAEEHNGAISMYLLSYDYSNNTAFLVPFAN